MPYLYLIGAVLCVSATNLLNAFYNRKNEGCKNIVPLYSLLYACATCLVWLVAFLRKPEFCAEVLLYSLGFGVFYVTGVFALALALKTGPIALTALFMKLSLVATTVWGFFFWGTAFTPVVGVGLGLIVISLALCLYKGKTEKKKISWKWLFYVFIGFVGNAGCTIVQRTQQEVFLGRYGETLMLFATLFTAIVFFIAYLLCEKPDFKRIVKKTGAFPVTAGVCNALLNLFVILTASTFLSPSLIYPVIAVGSLAMVTVFSLCVFKEKTTWWQWVGIAIGLVAVGLLSV